MQKTSPTATRAAVFAIVLILVAADSAPNEPTDCSVEAARTFNGKVHTVLQNACLNCHANMKSNFQLRRGDTATNLSAALKQVNRKAADESPLLRHATSAHGGMTRPPFKDANAPAYKHLEAWVKLVADPPKSIATKDPDEETNAPDSGSARIREARDPFDPEIFNRFAR